jgi:hypothetical protein
MQPPILNETGGSRADLKSNRLTSKWLLFVVVVVFSKE